MRSLCYYRNVLTAPNAGRFTRLPPGRRVHWRHAGDGEHFPRLVGVELEEVRRDYARMRLPYRSELTQPAGVVHGGAIAALIDSVVVPALASAYDEWRPCATVDMTVHYLASVIDEDMVAEGWITRRGRSLVFSQVEVRTASGRLAATGTLVYKLLRRPE